MAHRGLALAQPVTQVGDVKLAVGRQGEIEQDAQAGLVAQELENLSKFADRLIGHFRTRVASWPFVPDERLVSLRAMDVNPYQLNERNRTNAGSKPALSIRHCRARPMPGIENQS